MNEKDISLKCAKGDREAMKELYNNYSSHLFGVAIRYMGNKENALDLLHDSFIKIYSKIDSFKYRGDGSLKAWLTRIVINNAIYTLRKSNNFESIESNIYNITYDSNDIEPNLVPEDKILEFIAELPIGYRTVFNLFVIEEKSHKEIAKILGINQKSSSSQLLRAKAKLAEKIKEYIKKNS